MSGKNLKKIEKENEEKERKKKPLKSPDDPVSDGEIKRMRTLWNFATLIGKQDATDEEVIDYIRKSRAKKISKQRLEKRKQEEPQRLASRRIADSLRKTDLTSEKRFEEYCQAFNVETPNDKESVRQLISIEVRLEEIKKVRKGVDEVKALQQLAQEEKSLRSEWRFIQKSLAIDRGSRYAQQTDQSPAEILGNIIKDAKEFIDNEMKVYVCPKCHSETSWLWLNFPEKEWSFICTCGCGERMEFSFTEAA